MSQEKQPEEITDVTLKIDWSKQPSGAPSAKPDDTGSGLSNSRRFTVGTVVLKRYRILSELGRGGMGVVYLCQDEVAGIEVALKCLPPELSLNSFEMEEIKENFQLVTSLNHPNIAAYKQLERDEENGDYYLIMEYVKGEDLRSWIKKQRKEGKLTFRDALDVIYQVADALDYAHHCRIIHRDIKPGNIMINEQKQIKILDFGLAAQIHTSMSRISVEQSNKVSGTAPYMSPEQWCGRSLNAASDQYALAVMAYEMFAGHLPFDSADPMVLREAVMSQKPEDLKDIPRYANSSIQRAMYKNADERFPSCSDFAQSLSGKKQVGCRKQAFLFLAGVLCVMILLGLLWVLFGFSTPDQGADTEKAAAKVQPLPYPEESKRGIQFSPDGLTLKKFPALPDTQYTTPEQVTTIGYQAFHGNSNLEKLSLPGVKKIGEYAFADCGKLKEFVLSPELTGIGSYAFSGCTGLNKIEIPGKVEYLEDGTFYKCRNLQQVSLPESLTKIGRYAFSGCETLQYLELKNGVTTIDVGVFFGCHVLKEFRIPEGVTEIADLTFADCDQLKSVTIPAGVKRIGRNAFNGCSSLTDLTLPPALEEIQTAAFKNCHQLEKVVLPEKIKILELETFSDCVCLKEVILPAGLEQIQGRVFQNCKSLKTVQIPGNVGEIGAKAFANCNSLTQITIPESVQKVGDEAFDGCSDLQTITVPSHFSEDEIKKWRLPAQTKVVRLKKTGADEPEATAFTLGPPFVWSAEE